MSTPIVDIVTDGFEAADKIQSLTLALPLRFGQQGFHKSGEVETHLGHYVGNLAK